ncbi:MAG: DUF5916 domain-containing protein [Bacteroidota bacterium]
MPLSTLLLVVALAAPGNAPGTDDPTPLSLEVVEAESVTVDGALTEAAWADAEVATGFVQFEPDEGLPASDLTEVRVLRTPAGIVVGARMLTDDPGAIRQFLSRRDDTGGADAFFVAFDSYDDDRTAYVFGVTAAGVQVDAIFEGDGDDDSWDAVWSSAVTVGPDGWTAELSIPYSQLRFSEQTDAWGVQFQRITPARGEEAFWAPVTRAEAEGGFVRLFGRLDGVGGLRPRPVLEARPYTLGGFERFESDAIPGSGVNDLDGNLGADVKVGLSSNVILDATVNPDFGQVEADPAQLNLSTFEVVLGERRPFFVEGTQIFDVTIGSRRDGRLLYTRRIGSESPIIAATKLTGRTPGGLSFGALGSLTGDSFDPARLYAAGRVKQEFPGQSYIGGGLTAYSAFGTLDEGVTTAAGAADWAIRTLGGTWQFEGTTAGTLRRAGGATEVGSATYVGFDRVEGYLLPGFGLRAYTEGFRLNDLGQFRQTDLAQARGGVRYLLNEGEPVGPFRRFRTAGFLTQTWQLSDGANRGLSLFTFSGGQFRGFEELDLFFEVEGIGGLDVRETRGLGPVANLLSVGGNIGLDSDQRRPFRLGAGVGGRLAEDGGAGVRTGVEVEWTVSDRVGFDVEAGIGWGIAERAWAANEPLFLRDGALFGVAEADAPEAFGDDDLVRLDVDAALVDGLAPYTEAETGVSDATAYYVPLFGTRDTREADLTARGQVIFGPTLSLQLFGQLFAAHGRFQDFRVLTGPETFRDVGAYPKRRDFSFASFLANAVLRWEYRPGSTLFVVVSQSRDDRIFEEDFLANDLGPSPFETGTGQQIADTFEVFPRNTVLLKLNYLLMR